MIETENTQQTIDKPWLFKKGVSANPAGRPKGSRNATTLAVQGLFHGQAQKLTQKAIELALDGDSVALRLCLDRILPAIKELPVNVKLPSMMTAAELPTMTAAIIRAVSSGDLLPGEAEKISKLIDTHRAAIELADFDSRLKALETAQEITE